MMSATIEMKFFWFMVIVLCASGSIYNTRIMIHDYGEDSTSTLITVFPVSSLKFPTMIFCPRNPDFLHYEPIYEDMVLNIYGFDNMTYQDVLAYAIAGFGFDNMPVDSFNETYLDTIGKLYSLWKGKRSQLDMFDFVFNQNGYNCSDLLQQCYDGATTWDCCKIFEPTYVMHRGRCMRLVSWFRQNSTDEVSKLTVYFNDVPSPIVGTTQQIQVFTGDDYQEVGLGPRYYLNPDDWNRMRFTQKRMILEPGKQNTRCSTELVAQGKYTCFVYNWVAQMNRIYNCTVPYYKNMLSYTNYLPVCDAKLIVDNYSNFTETPRTECLPACTRTENSIQFMSSIDYDPNPSYKYRLEASFTYLEYEQYKELSKQSVASFISQLGGQSGLFLGCSVMTFVQLGLSICMAILALCAWVYDKMLCRIRIGLWTTHPSESIDKFYPRQTQRRFVDTASVLDNEDLQVRLNRSRSSIQDSFIYLRSENAQDTVGPLGVSMDIVSHEDGRITGTVGSSVETVEGTTLTDNDQDNTVTDEFLKTFRDFSIVTFSSSDDDFISGSSETSISREAKIKTTERG